MFTVHDTTPSSVYSLATQVFTRAGSYLGVAAKPFRHTKMQDMGRWGTTDIFLITGRGGAVGARGGNLCMKLRPIHNGVRVPFAVQGGPTELKLLTAYGDIRFCFAETGLLLIKGENGLSLALEADLDLHRIFRKRAGQSWEGSHGACCCLVYTPVAGKLELTAPYDMDKLSTPQVRGEIFPDETGAFLLAVEEFRELGYVRDSYPSYEDALQCAKADWEACLAAQPAIPAFAAGRERAAYLTWSSLTAPSGRAKHTQIWREFGHIADSFQSCLCAAALDGNLPTAIDLLLAQLDEQSPDGQIPVFFDDMRGLNQTVVPPAQGWTLEWLMRTHDLKKEVPAEQLETLYMGLSKWARWFDTCRAGGDGALFYESAEECGLADNPIFRALPCAALPDLPAFLALLEEKLGNLAEMLGRETEAEPWYVRSRTRIGHMLDRFWDGSRFIGRAPDGSEIRTESLLFFRPLILGARLPADVIEAMAEDLGEGNGYLTPAGFLTQRMTSPDYNPLYAGSGRVSAMESALITTGLLLSGKDGAAKEAAGRYCAALLQPVSPVWPAERGFPSSVTAAAFRMLAALAE